MCFCICNNIWVVLSKICYFYPDGLKPPSRELSLAVSFGPLCFDMLIKEGKRRKRRMQMDYLELCEAGRRI